MKTSRRKKIKDNLNTYIINTIIGSQKCTNCGKRKVIHFYEVKNKLWDKTELKILMCRDCLEELKFKILESPSKEKQVYQENMINIINDMLKEK